MQKRHWLLFVEGLVGLLICVVVCSGCGAARARVPIGTVPVAAQTTAEDEQYGEEVLRQLTMQYPLSRNEALISRTRRIVGQLTDARKDLSDAYWHVYVLEGDIMNAAATRGNFIFIWSKMLQTVPADEEIAAVLAHEIGHVLAGHPMPNPAEQANEMITGVAGMATREVLSASPSIGPFAGIAGALVEGALGALIVNPESQRKELEADQIGLFLMSDAGFHPAAAVRFWENASNNPSFGSAGPEILSSHPSSTKRRSELERLLPFAQRRYDENVSGGKK